MPEKTPHTVDDKGGMDLSGVGMSSSVAVRDTGHCER